MTLAKPSPGDREAVRSAPSGGGSHYRPAFSVIDTKLAAPLAQAGIVQRERLLALLAAANPRVVSLVAPPGYGKTTLLSQWAAAQDVPVAWLTVDDRDNDPLVLTSYLATAIDRIHPIQPETAKLLAGGGRRILASVVPRLVFELSTWS